MWDDMLVYVAEMCRNLEVFQINSQECTDGSINHMIRKCTNLKALDVSGLTKFVGLAFQDLDDNEFVARNLRWLQVNLEGHEMLMLKERLSNLAPECQILLQTKKNFTVCI